MVNTLFSRVFFYFLSRRHSLKLVQRLVPQFCNVYVDLWCPYSSYVLFEVDYKSMAMTHLFSGIALKLKFLDLKGTLLSCPCILVIMFFDHHRCLLMLICLGFQSIMIPFSCSIFLNHENYKKFADYKKESWVT